MTYKEQMDQEFQRGMEKGLEEGIEKGIQIFIADKIEENVPMETILEKLQNLFGLDPEKAKEYCEKFSRKQKIS